MTERAISRRRYALNIGYNIYNKVQLFSLFRPTNQPFIAPVPLLRRNERTAHRARSPPAQKFLNAVPLPWTAATVQLFAGIPYVALLWATGLRRAPRLSVGDLRTLSSSAFVTTAGHVGGVISFGAGAISFTHIVKATEPVLSALITAVFFREVRGRSSDDDATNHRSTRTTHRRKNHPPLSRPSSSSSLPGQFLPLPVYASMVPIVGGVALASLKELSFSWWSFATALASAVASASKSILSKKVLDGKPLGENLTPTNM